MPDQLAIRDAEERDLPAILDIYNEVILHTTAVYSEEPHTLKMRREWYLDRIQNGFPVLVASAGDEIVGFCSFGHFRIWPCYRYTAELSLYVNDRHRGKGIGREMLQTLICKAKEMEIHALIAGISADNIPSIKLHLSAGFTEVAHFYQVGYKFDRWLDLKFFELLIR
ncbi:MAG TPA: GNAT family N-acetyltransferase [Mucilaginibacter sp.]|nr:GNAT family N-acetyltransferase [Mucilaginibacter sp.]